LNKINKATINFTADGNTNGRPTITITTTRGPNSPTLTASSPTSQNSFTYNIPVQHLTNSSSPSQSHILTGGTTHQLASFPNQFIITTGDMFGQKPTLISNGSYIIPVSMKLMSNNNNALSSSSPPSSPSPLSPPLHHTLHHSLPVIQAATSNTASRPIINGGGFNSVISNSTNTNTNNQTKNQIGNILIKTTTPNNNNNVNIKNKVEDEVDLLKDLLIKKLNTTNDLKATTTQTAANNAFYGVCVKCNDKIVGVENGLKAMDNLFHVTCFICYGCSMN
jgi:hypothetical protein